MNSTLLFDLDDTLLGNNMDMFLPAYLQALSAHMASYAEPRRLVKTLMSASDLMLANLNPACTLEDVFDAGFYPPLGIEKEQVRAVLDTFYAQEFPKLRALTQYRPEAVKLVETALTRGYRVAIATNSLFPQTAVTQRLEWAGLSPEEFPFTLIPSYHTFHFAKPNPAYFTELLAKLAWPEGVVVMAGDSFIDDISSAHQAGIASFWVTSEKTSVPENQHTAKGIGNLNDFFAWLDSCTPESLIPDFSPPSAVIATLRATPAVLHSLFSRLSREDWIHRPSQGEWSAIEILCHLADMDSEVNLPRLRKVLNHVNPFLAGVDTDAWAEARQYIQRDSVQMFKKYITTRLELITFLEGLSPEGWQRRARHAVFGPTSLHEMANFAASHDRLHVRQLFQTIPNHEPI